MGRGMETLDPSDRAMYRYKFRESISKGLDGIQINLFGALRRGMNNPLSMFVWKCPSVYGPEHIGRVQSTIQACMDVAPKCLSSEMAKRFNNIISQLSSVSLDVRKAMKHYLFLGYTNPQYKFSEEYCQFITDLAAGLPIDPSFVLSRLCPLE